MEKENKYFKGYSSETTELLSRPHSWLVNSGTTIIFIIIVLVFLVSHFIRYPELAVAPVTVYGNQLKTSLYAKSQSKIVYLNTPNTVEEGDIVMVLESTTDWKEALKLENKLNEWDSLQVTSELSFYQNLSFTDFYNLGVLQPLYESFKIAVNDFQLFLLQDAASKKASSIQSELAIQEKLALIGQEKINLENRNYDIAKQTYRSDSMLFANQAISKQEFLQSQSTFLRAEAQLIQQKEASLNAQVRANQLRQQVNELNDQNQERNAQYISQVVNAKNQLKKALLDWKLLYVIESPISGNLSSFEPLNLYQNVSPSEELLYVIPNKRNYFAYAQVESRHIGKLRQMQQKQGGNPARIKLEAYPFARYGWLDAQVEQVSLTPVEEKYNIKVKLTNGFITSRGVSLEGKPELSGTIEIVLEERSLLEKFLEQTVYSTEELALD